MIGSDKIIVPERDGNGTWWIGKWEEETGEKLPNVYITVDPDIIGANPGGYMPISFKIKNGKVSSISFGRS